MADHSARALRIAIVGVGNCASSLVQGIAHYRGKRPDDAVGLMHWEIGGVEPGDLEVAVAFDVDLRKVGKDVSEAIFEEPNCTKVFCERLPKTGVRVRLSTVRRRTEGGNRRREGKGRRSRSVVGDIYGNSRRRSGISGTVRWRRLSG